MAILPKVFFFFFSFFNDNNKKSRKLVFRQPVISSETREIPFENHYKRIKSFKPWQQAKGKKDFVESGTQTPMFRRRASHLG